jgi:transcriptional regulator with XRE-family HTH domain
MSDTNPMLGRVIRRLRTESGISQEGLAAISGIDRTFMGEIERGEANPSFDVLQRIASGLGVLLSELIRQYESEK